MAGDGSKDPVARQGWRGTKTMTGRNVAGDDRKAPWHGKAGWLAKTAMMVVMMMDGGNYLMMIMMLMLLMLENDMLIA